MVIDALNPARNEKIRWQSLTSQLGKYSYYSEHMEETEKMVIWMDNALIFLIKQKRQKRQMF